MACEPKTEVLGPKEKPVAIEKELAEAAAGAPEAEAGVLSEKSCSLVVSVDDGWVSASVGGCSSGIAARAEPMSGTRAAARRRPGRACLPSKLFLLDSTPPAGVGDVCLKNPPHSVLVHKTDARSTRVQ